MSVVIRVEDVSKLYRLGQVGTGTLSADLTRMWARFRGKEDPFLKIGQTNDRTKKATHSDSEPKSSFLSRISPLAARDPSDLVWALKDINFDVKEGEVLGIIGRNGAGKSTLLKLLARVTQPTTGQIKVRGRIASLLEVGTGFHPDLTGRENIFLNGAILGMRKHEIHRKLDEIIDFSGCERYIDTPVKRYSSGMYVRLAFAVAAHLEPEILIVDEVLAVGDAEFQKKCLGKMKDVASGGRTILFVSHNMTAIGGICTHCLYLDAGRIKNYGTASSVMARYTSDALACQERARIAGKSLLQKITLTSFRKEDASSGWIIELEFAFSNIVRANDVGIDVIIRNKDVALAFAGSAYFQPITICPRTRKVQCVIGPINYAIGHYEIDVYVNEPMRSWLEEHTSCASFDVERQSDASLFFQLDSNRNIGLMVPAQTWYTDPPKESTDC